jgi:hypothetical protein
MQVKLYVLTCGTKRDLIGGLMYVYLYVDSSCLQDALFVQVKLGDDPNKIWLPVSIEEPEDYIKAQFSLSTNSLGEVRQSKTGYSFFIKLLNLNMPDLKIEVDKTEIVKLSAMSIKHSVKKLDDVLTACLQDRLQVALSDIEVKLTPPDQTDQNNELQDPDAFDIILSAVDLSDEDFKRSAVMNGALDLNFVGSVNFKDYRELDYLIEKIFDLVEEENVRLRNRISFTEFEKKLKEGKIHLVNWP